jgi:predicted DNA-binding transcriptional regulator AlpA
LDPDPAVRRSFDKSAAWLHHGKRSPTAGDRIQQVVPVITMSEVETVDPLLTAEDVALRLRVSKDWVWDHSSRRLPYLPVIRMSDGALRYRASGIEEFLKERERASLLRRKRRLNGDGPLIPSTQKIEE